MPLPQIRMTMAEAYDQKGVSRPLMETEGAVSAEFVYLYPPGIPVLAPGEVICGRHLEQIRQAMEQGLSVEGPEDMSLKYLKVL